MFYFELNLSFAAENRGVGECLRVERGFGQALARLLNLSGVSWSDGCAPPPGDSWFVLNLVALSHVAETQVGRVTPALFPILLDLGTQFHQNLWDPQALNFTHSINLHKLNV